MQGSTGFKDDNGGLDYHIPVDFGDHVEVQYSDDESSASDQLANRRALELLVRSDQGQDIVPKSTLNVVHVSVEMAPIAKVN